MKSQVQSVKGMKMGIGTHKKNMTNMKDVRLPALSRKEVVSYVYL